ncbi:hypothetical protein [Heliophilum fasciatum]|nr:hypothetical protein [Heliophilum fasciatum]MCW2276982.1 hypothetical protein [Heliophilum fasciatum]
MQKTREAVDSFPDTASILVDTTHPEFTYFCYICVLEGTTLGEILEKADAIRAKVGEKREQLLATYFAKRFVKLREPGLVRVI